MTWWVGVEWLVGVALLALLAGYAWGRRRGRRDGFTEGLRYAPLEMRRASLEKGTCVLCGAGAVQGQPPDDAV
ncbi:MAG: hypothetical protein FWJ73_03780 [Limnochordales bacterium]|nr:hypothetical protein [Bacillota bacterium]